MNNLNSITENIFHFVDLTCLKEHVSPEDIAHLVTEGQRHHVAALCVWPKDLKYIPGNCTIPKATVVNFPEGNQSVEVVLNDIEHILKSHPGTEIDYVFPYQDYLAGKQDRALKHCKKIADYCHEQGVIFKIILETGLFPTTELIEEVSLKVIQCGADFLKTSTGKVAIGATPEAVVAICHAIAKSQSHCGIKISGGVKSMCQAISYLELIHDLLPEPPHPKWLRFGCSQLVNDLK